ncbi:hypothetical protein C8Q76DRAFT_591558, partial [Earliella scabrosa]
MTDFASQGRTRPYNVCDLQNCKTHQSVYTCLSRGSTLEGTIIVQSFDTSKFTGGISGSLRQEFRELELLDEITKMRYLGTISPKVLGITRNELIHSFRKWKGESFIPNEMHQALQWTNGDPFPIDPPTDDAPWTVIKEKNKTHESTEQSQESKRPKRNMMAFVPAQGSQVLRNVNNEQPRTVEKRKQIEDSEIAQSRRTRKRQKTTISPTGHTMRGFPWDSVNHSCAYDSLLTILLSVYCDNYNMWKAEMSQQS